MTMRTLTHPNLPGREIEVHEQAVAHHARAGWVDSTEAEAALEDFLPAGQGKHEAGDSAAGSTDDGDQAGDDNNETEK